MRLERIEAVAVGLLLMGVVVGLVVGITIAAVLALT